MNEDFMGTSILIKDGKAMLTGNVCYYLVDSGEVDTAKPNKMYIPPVEEVMGVNYIPYVKGANFETVDVMLKSKFFENFSFSEDEGRLHRIKNMRETMSLVTTFEPNFSRGKNIGGTWKWQNEGKLWLHPYHYGEMWDGLSNPVPYALQGIDESKSTQTLRIRTSLNTSGLYQLYIDGYRGDSIGMAYGVQTGGNPFPTSSSAYLNYMASNQSSIKQGYMNLALQSVSGAVGSALTGNVLGAISSVASGLLGANTELAKQTDLKGQGFTLKDSGGDALHGLQQAEMMCRYTYGYREEELNRIGMMFHKYGYAQNKTMKPNLNSRKYWNYIKATDVVFNNGNNKIAKTHQEKLKDILANGTTIWHVTRLDGNAIGNYTVDNPEY